MTIAPFTSRDNLGRYYTDNGISEFLISQMDTTEAQNILDLGCGLGSLSFAASRRWNDAKIFSLDIEHRSPDAFHRHENQHHVVGDALQFDLPRALGVQEGSIDLAVCNPPYLKPNWRDEFQEVADQIGLCKYSSISKICSAEVIFLAQMLRMLKTGGEAGVILPDGIFTAEKFSGFREFLVKEHFVKKIIQLPRNIFKRTEAKTHILILNKSVSKCGRDYVELSCVQGDGSLSPTIKISPCLGVERLDYSYHWRRLNSQADTKLSAKMIDVAEIKRGKHSSVDISRLECATVHTTNIKGFNDALMLPGKKDLLDLELPKFLIAGPGDILMARVGRGFFNKVAYVQSGYAVVSDCLFRVRAKGYQGDKLFRYLVSDSAQSSLADLSYGVAASQISMKQLSEFNVPLGKI
ncbi:N-6 DNA methylase [Pseudomonas sp. YuFO20]|uniref:N-6 DNA methylase n=1 Tax=Pseudomonas sp. YuFO20 TaxID=3095362 RepID=UPI002B24A6D7|nr:N-6 DNA methylase [Pseudomonas sp. YuFO20]MEB2517328.1 N-6 DNA methylase [Pseudomonas sp. YuFO20]